MTRLARLVERVVNAWAAGLVARLACGVHSPDGQLLRCASNSVVHEPVAVLVGEVERFGGEALAICPS
jgi:hypothetical protein